MHLDLICIRSCAITAPWLTCSLVACRRRRGCSSWRSDGAVSGATVAEWVRRSAEDACRVTVIRCQHRRSQILWDEILGFCHHLLYLHPVCGHCCLLFSTLSESVLFWLFINFTFGETLDCVWLSSTSAIFILLTLMQPNLNSPHQYSSNDSFWLEKNDAALEFLSSIPFCRHWPLTFYTPAFVECLVWTDPGQLINNTSTPHMAVSVHPSLSTWNWQRKTLLYCDLLPLLPSK